MLKVEKLTKRYGNITLFSDFSFSFKRKGLYFLLGESGCGKSTLLNILSGLDNNYYGKVIFNSKDLKRQNILSLRRNNFGFIFQFFNLFENDTVFNNLRLVLENKNEHEIKKSIDDVLKKINISNLKEMVVKNLSGGEKQRVCIARCLLSDVDVIFADEPTGSLDNENAIKIFEILKEIKSTKLVIVVSHDENMANKYADFILKFNNGKIEIIKESKIKEKNSFYLKKEKKRNKISLKFIFHHIKNDIKNKRFRHFISNIFFSFSLLVFGISFLINYTLKDNLVSSFDSLMGNESLVLKRKNDDINIKEFYGASKSEVEEIKNRYEDEIDRIGVNYVVDFENFFKDRNELYNVTNTPISLIENFNIRLFNEFSYIHDYRNLKIDLNKELNNDEVILGMNYPSMKSLCSSLFIEKTYESLNEYLKNNKVLIALFLKNEDWNYSDEQMFILKGVLEDNRQRVYHTNPLFNEFLFEECMRFPTTLDINSIPEYPFVMKKVYYVNLINFQSIFFDKVNNDKDLSNYLFENDNIRFSPLFYNKESRKQYVFSIFGTFFNKQILSNLKEYIDISSYYYSTNGGYINYGNSMFSGFANPLFIAKNRDKVEEFVDKYLSLNVDKRNELIIDEDIAYGDSLSIDGENVKFTTLKEKLKVGNNPIFKDEIGISSALAKKLNLSITDEVYLVLVNPDYSKHQNDEQFKTIKLNVSGIYENDSLLIYQDPLYSISLFRDLFKISSFNLIVNSIVIESQRKYSEEYITKLNKLLDEYEFVNMLSYIKSSISSTLSIIEIILLVVSLFVMIFAVIILITINFIKFNESKKEIATFSLLGYDNFEINKVFFFENLELIFLSMIESIFGMIIMSLLISVIVSKELNVSINYSFPLIPIILIIVLTIVICLIIYPILLKSIKKINISKSMHS